MDLSLTAAKQLSQLPFIDDIEVVKRRLDSLRPLPKEIEERVIQKFRLDWNYHSNAIEGNQLTYGETVAFIMEGITAKGKTLKDHLDIKGHDEAIRFILSLIKDPEYILTEADIRSLHQIILKEPYWADAVTAEGRLTRKEIKIGQYKSTSNHVKTPTGEIHYYATPEQAPILMGELMQWLREATAEKDIHALVVAALFHPRFTAIHPFDDGNGRMARLLMNLILMQSGYLPIIIKQDDRNNYYQVLRQADAGEFIPIVQYMADLLTHSLKLYISAAKGESIAEPGDIDKEIELFRKSIIPRTTLNKNEKKSETNVRHLFEEKLNPFFARLQQQVEKIEDLFEQQKVSIEVEYGYDDILGPVKKFTRFEDYAYSIAHLSDQEFQSIKSIDFSIALTKLKNFSTTINSGVSICVLLPEAELVLIDRTYSNKIILNYSDPSIETQLRDFENECMKSLLKELRKNTNI
jgi:Fic family protein